MKVGKGLGIGLAVLAIPAVTYAGDSDSHGREVRLEHMYAGADQATSGDAYYAQSRDAFLTGDGSLEALTTAWERDAQEWIDGWFKIFALADLTEDVPFEEFQMRLAQAMQDQASALERLKARAEAIDAAAAEGERLLGRASVPDALELADYKEIIEGLRRRESELRDAMGDVGGIASSRMRVLEEMGAKSRVIIIARVKAALIAHARYPLDQAMAKIQEYLEAAATVDPILAQVTAAEDQMNRLTLNLEVFQADDALEASRTLCARAKSSLDGVTGAATFVNAAKQRVEELCGAIEDHYTALASAGIPRSKIVFRYVATARGQIHALCSVASPPVSCEKLAIVAALDQADLDAMDDAHLRFVEVGFTKALEAARRKERAI